MMSSIEWKPIIESFSLTFANFGDYPAIQPYCEHTLIVPLMWLSQDVMWLPQVHLVYSLRMATASILLVHSMYAGRAGFGSGSVPSLISVIERRGVKSTRSLVHIASSVGVDRTTDDQLKTNSYKWIYNKLKTMSLENGY